MYDQASQLNKHGKLKYIVTNYPKYYVKKFHIDEDKVVSLLFTGVLHRSINKLYRYLGIKIPDSITKLLHNLYSKEVVPTVKKKIDFFIGLSSFSLEGIKKANEYGVITIVDHGSINLEIEKEILLQEFKKFDVNKEYFNTVQNWIIDKENEEFIEADYILLGSTFAKETFIKKGFSENKLLVNNYGVDLNSFKHVEKMDNKFRIIYCGSFSIGKGLHYLLKAFNELKINNAELWLVGASKIVDKALLEVIRKMNINFENIIFKGQFPQNELYKLYSQGTIFILPSLADGFAMVVPQALSCGLPVIVTESTGAKDIVKEGVNGFIIPPANKNAIKEKIEYLYNNADECEKMSKNAISSVLNGLTWDNYGDRLIDILEKCAKNRDYE
ncbi:glycosyltransferase family 4 protein [Sulfurimonas sp.]|uniref:glycosyltransferase family 4 protein n=1 Tax=Sulfurimonas sp. TaxID=2022749 RepID=UPI00356535D4